VPYAHPGCQPGTTHTSQKRGISPRTDDTQCPNPSHNTSHTIRNTEHTIEYSGAQADLVRGADQEVERTQSRRTGPRAWLRAARWLIAAGHHRRANATTLKIAEDLAHRMDYTTGHVLYGLDDMVARLGISRASIARHVGYLRELGALAWVQHGNRTNMLAKLGLKGYKGTATVYAAVIPPVYDHAMGHTIVGSGYTARIVIDQRGQQPRIPAQARRSPVDNPPVENPASAGRETPSLTWLRKESQVQVDGGFNYTEQARPPKARPRHHSSSINGRPRTASDVANAMKTVRLVRALVNWTQSVPLRRLEYVLRPWTDRGWDACRIADELHGLCSGMRWKPKRPDAFIRAQIAKDTAWEQQQAQLAAEQAQAVAWKDSTEYRNRMSLAALFGSTPQQPAEEPERTDEDRQRARMDWNNWPQVLDHFEEDGVDALDLYGDALIAYALRQGARTRRNDHTYL
jgi:hypothetical protein